MTVAAQLGQLQEKYSQIERAADFAAIARILLAGRGQFHQERLLRCRKLAAVVAHSVVAR